MSHNLFISRSSRLKYKYYSSCACNQCSYRKLDKKKNLLILKAFKNCVDNENTSQERIEKRKNIALGGIS